MLLSCIADTPCVCLDNAHAEASNIQQEVERGLQGPRCIQICINACVTCVGIRCPSEAQALVGWLIDEEKLCCEQHATRAEDPAF